MSKFTPKERQEIESLQNTVHNRGASHLEKDIARAKLHDMIKSKGGFFKSLILDMPSELCVF